MAIKVLIVEDDKNISDLLQLYLQKEGYTVVSITAEGGVLDKNTAGGELEAYEHVVVPHLGTKEMTVTVTVERAVSRSTGMFTPWARIASST